MKGRKATKKVAKVVHSAKCTVDKKIVWMIKDNLCLLYAIWEMFNPKQRALLTFNYTVSFIDGIKKSMGLFPKQRIVKGIGSADILRFFKETKATYKTMGRSVVFTWRKLCRNRSPKHKGFNGGSIEKNILLNQGMYILFGRSKINNPPHHAFIKALKILPNESERFLLFALKANGLKTSDHAIGISVSGNNQPLIYDNSNRNCVPRPFTVINFANKMSDISNGFLIDFYEN